MAKEARVVYYTDEKSDEFSGISKNTVRVGGDFPFVHEGRLWRVGEFFVYRVLMKPVAYIWSHLKFSVRFQGCEALREFRDRGYFLYSNHTLMAGDAYIPNLLDPKKRTYVVVHPDNISTRGMKNFVLMCGAVPLPTELSGFRAFLETIRRRIGEGGVVCIYPEAHIWPYCTKVRDFSDASFSYPVKCGAPVFCSTVTYSEPLRFGIPRVTVYVDGPFYPDPSLGLRAAQKKLRDEVYAAMCERAEKSSYEKIRYVKK